MSSCRMIWPQFRIKIRKDCCFFTNRIMFSQTRYHFCPRCDSSTKQFTASLLKNREDRRGLIYLTPCLINPVESRIVYYFHSSLSDWNHNKPHWLSFWYSICVNNEITQCNNFQNSNCKCRTENNTNARQRQTTIIILGTRGLGTRFYPRN